MFFRTGHELQIKLFFVFFNNYDCVVEYKNIQRNFLCCHFVEIPGQCVINEGKIQWSGIEIQS